MLLTLPELNPQRLLLGTARSPVVLVDGLPCDWSALVAAAEALAPFPPAAGIYYPGLRRVFGEADEPAWSLTLGLIEAAAPFIAGGFDCDTFHLVEANFSLVTTAPQALAPMQRHPHFDSTDPCLIALIAYLFDAPSEQGTAFYRHAASGIEVVAPGNVDRLVGMLRRQAETLEGYFAPGDPHFEEIGRVPARFGRVGIWRGNLLHSGLVGDAANFSPDPRRGRLTLNLFLELDP